MAISVTLVTPVDDGSSGAGTPGLTVAITAAGVAAGDILLVPVWVDNTANPTIAVADSVNAGGYTIIQTAITDSNGQKFSWLYKENSAAGSPVITATFGASSVYKAIACFKISGGKLSSSLDGSAAHNFQSTPTTAADAVTSGSASNAAQPALVLSVSMSTATNPPAVGTGMTSLGTGWTFGGQPFGARFAYKLVNSTTAQTAKFTAGTNDEHLTSIAIFDELGAGATAVSDDTRSAGHRQLQNNAVYRMSPRAQREAQQFLRAQKRAYGFASAAV